MDGDGIANATDAFPLGPTGTIDTDDNNIGNIAILISLASWGKSIANIAKTIRITIQLILVSD